MEGYEAADCVGPGVFFDRFDGDERYEDILVRSGLLLECANAIVYLIGFGFGEGIVAFGVFDFADVQEAVGPVDDEVDLGTGVGRLAAPGVIFRKDAVHTDGAKDLRDVGHGHLFVCEAVPVVLGGGVECVLPVVGVGILTLDEGGVEEREKVHELVEASVGTDAFAEDVVVPDEVAVDEVFQHVAEVAVVGDLEFLCNLPAGEAFLGVGKEFDDGFITLRCLEEGLVEALILTAKLGTLGEEKGINVVGKGHSGIQEAQIVRYATQNHIGLEDGDVVPLELAGLQEFPGFLEVEREDMHLVRDAVVKSALVVDDVADNPGGGETADDEHQFFLAGAPFVPEVVQGFDKV